MQKSYARVLKKYEKHSKQTGRYLKVVLLEYVSSLFYTDVVKQSNASVVSQHQLLL
jgi:hypothetical protein